MMMVLFFKINKRVIFTSEPILVSKIKLLKIHTNSFNTSLIRVLLS